MVLQSILQFRAFEHSAEVRQLGDAAHAESNEKAPERPHRQDSGEESVPSEQTRLDSSDDHDDTRAAFAHGKGKRNNGKLTSSSQQAQQEGSDPFLVDWAPGEAANPQNWSWTKKWCLVLMVTSIGLLVGVAASIDSSAATFASKKFGVTEEVVELQTAVFLIGFGLAAPIFGPLSEIGGRNPVYVLTLLFFILFEIGSALAPNIQTRVILRFFAGFFGSTPLSNAGGSIADCSNPRQRTFVFPIFANAGFLGPVLGPAIGGYLGWKVGEEWCEWITAIWGGVVLLVVVCFMPETYAPTLLKMKAENVRRATGDKRYKTALEKQRETVPFKKAFKHSLAMPFLYLIYEPIVLLVSLYMTMIYIILFGDFEAYTLIYEPFGLNPGEIGLTFISVAIGLFVTTAFTPILYKRYVRLEKSARDSALERGKKDWETREPEPEERLIVAMIGTWLIPISLFYQGWTAFPGKVSVWVPISSGILFGAGILTCFIASYQYIIDVYKTGSASALASLTFIRYIVSGGAVLFTPPMYKRLGNHWALSLLAFLSLVFSFIPWLFYIYGKRIRAWSRYAPSGKDD